ncbi:hypothetical protein IHQ76_09345 [Bifidobacterium dentium]|uniref:glycoside hydrolase family 25 protein n=3 Tax=Bifidobacterium dentium TaxID=1689 RepID=UPI0018C26645|nr:glycoside hydrolase family 25 protein [Bifidobacterium dentium]MBF9713153.1 hypothetical protein [Bifidobacterium dentium]
MKMLRELVSSAAVAATAITLILASAVPAHALQDTSISAAEKSAADAILTNQEKPSSESMPDNPQIPLPDSISESILDDATIVSADLAITPEGELKNIETGETVEDPGAAAAAEAGNQQPDPLAKTDGESFIPVSAATVKAAVEEVQSETSADGQERRNQSSLTSSGSIRFAKFESNSYGAHWGTCNGTKAFFDYENNLFVQQAKGVIDVSTWQGDIDWAKAKADGVEGAIIRLGYGEGNSIDTKAKRNISECKRLGIPFGIYWYSYADTGSMANAEAHDIVAKLKQVGVSAKDLTYPIYYDLEKWSGWTGHTPPTSVSAYDNIVNSWYNVMRSNGYPNLGVYSYTSYLQGPLNSANIHAKTRWVAQYGAKMGFTEFSTNDRGWQYTSIGHVDGIDGNVDMNAFGNRRFVSENYPKGVGFYVSNKLQSGAAEFSFAYGRTGDEVYIGDWDGDGFDTLAVRRGNFFYIKNSLNGGNADVMFSYGRQEDTVLVGDWDGDGRDTLAVRRGNEYFIKNAISGGVADQVVAYGRAGDQVLAGDWDGDGFDTLAVRRGNFFYIKNSLNGGNADVMFSYGRQEDTVLVGDWDGDGRDTLAVRRGNEYFIKNTISGGIADATFFYGKAEDATHVGDWDGDGKDTLMVQR